jgi:hypothetical protein
MAELRREMRRRMVGNGYGAPVEGQLSCAGAADHLRLDRFGSRAVAPSAYRGDRR